MGFAVLSGAATGGLFLLLTAVFFTCAVIPFWYKHENLIVNGDFVAIKDEDEPFPPLTLLFLFLTFAAFGVFRYVSVSHTQYAGHLLQIVQKQEDSTNWRVRGLVVEEPKLRGDYLEVLIQPQTICTIQRRRVRTSGARGGYENVVEESEAEIVTGGLVLAQVFEDMPAFREVEFRHLVEIDGQLREPSIKRNPGSLDYRQYLRNRGIFRTIRVVPRQAEFRIVDEESGGAVWYRFALRIKNEVLKVIKQTMPYPESSFLGGVLLGLRGGLPAKVSQEFRMTGVSHVLAVSGLHVTIIAGLLYGIFTMFKVPLKAFAPLIVFSLFTFALIVGWPSSAVRAALMNSLFILSRAYLKERGFKLSVVFSLCVAADFILYSNPLQLTEPSFVLSVMAIYALAMFSEPAGEMLRRMLRGPGLLFAAASGAFFFMAVILKRDLVLLPYFFPLTFIYIVASCYISNKLANLSTFQSFAFEMLPKWLQGFLAAQVAIFVAMMGPLSAFYFGQLSLAAPVANLIAIPLIGLIVQIGLIAGLIGAFVPFIGIHIALILNAANWLAVKFFMGMASFFAMLIPFPRISQPGFGELMVYYFILHTYFFWDDIVVWSKAIYAALVELWEDQDYRNSLGLVGGLVVCIMVFGALSGVLSIERRPETRLTMLDVGYGSSLLVEAGGKTLLIDSGLNDVLAEFDRGERVIQPALSDKKVRQIDAVILSSALPERISGLSSVLEAYKVARIYTPFPINDHGEKMTFEEYVRQFSLGDRRIDNRIRKGERIGSPPAYYWELAYDSYNKLIEDIHRFKIPVTRVKAGDVINELPGTPIEVIYPEGVSQPFKQHYDGLILKIVSRQNSFLYLSGNAYPLDDLDLAPDFVFVADLPHPFKSFEQFINKNPPVGIAVSFRFPSSWLIENYHLGNLISSRNRSYMPRFREWTVPVYVTNTNGAIEVKNVRNIVFAEPYVTD